MDAATRWRAELADWAIPPDILANAPESPYGFPPGMFVAPEEPRDTPSRRVALEALPAQGGRVLDVGCGGGAAAFGLAPPAAEVTGVDSSAPMLEMFAAAAERRRVRHVEVLGDWPAAASRAGRADVAVAHHVVYNVPDLVDFAGALTAATDRRVVLELTDSHPWTPTNPLWEHFHGLRRPSGPTAALAEQVLRAAGLPVHAEQWRRPPQGIDRAAMVTLVRRRLCLPESREPEVEAVLPAEYTLVDRGVTTLWWEAR